MEYSDGDGQLRQGRLYPNVKGCGYPPQLDCDSFFTDYGLVGEHFPCLVSSIDPEILIHYLDNEKVIIDITFISLLQDSLSFL